MAVGPDDKRTCRSTGIGKAPAPGLRVFWTMPPEGVGADARGREPEVQVRLYS
jgi:hypothetical protein